MSDFLEQVYDDMEWTEVICRLPGELAVGSLKRRIQGPDDLVSFFKAAAVEKETSKCVPVRAHINDIVRKSNNVGDILDTVGEEWHPVLHGYLDDANKQRFLKEGAGNLSVKFLFNLTDASDADGMRQVLDRVLSEPKPEVSRVLSILSKINTDHFQTLADVCLRHSDPSVRASLLSVYNEYNYDTISDNQKMIALKAFAKIPSSEQGPRGVQAIDFKLFKGMKPLERLLALDRYLSYFPIYQKRKAFDPAPSKEELEDVLFAGCFQYYDLVESIKNKYMAITEQESPGSKDEEQ